MERGERARPGGEGDQFDLLTEPQETGVGGRGNKPPLEAPATEGWEENGMEEGLMEGPGDEGIEDLLGGFEDRPQEGGEERAGREAGDGDGRAPGGGGGEVTGRAGRDGPGVGEAGAEG